jgi:hypothetical protein
MEQGFEHFSVYGFSIDYPEDSHVEFNPKSRRGEGDVVFHFPDKTKIFLSWGDLEKALKRFSTVEEHANHSLNRVKTARNVKSFERISHESFRIRSHEGVYNQAKVEELTAGLFTGKRRSLREAHSVHVHCPKSSRFFVIYALLPIGPTYDYAKTFTSMANSLRCH